MTRSYLRNSVCFVIAFAVFGWSPICSQDVELASVAGKIMDKTSGAPIELVTVYLDKTNIATNTDEKGEFVITFPARESYMLKVSRIGYEEIQMRIDPLQPGVIRNITIRLSENLSGPEVVVRASTIEDAGIVRENVEELKLIPSTTGNLESVLPSIALGTTSGTGGELTSQYNVRGGNYDENLVYVNDFEIYRPQLIRAGQQEGLSFPNIDLTSSLAFSSGGFESKYGDKLSSVLDIKYKRPDSLRGSVSGSFLGASAHLEGSFNTGKSDYRKLRYLVGARYKTTQYLLGSLDTKGEYTPQFADVQTYLTYDLSKDWQLAFLGNYNYSQYKFVPAERTTGLGLIDFALSLQSVFEGQEVDDFISAMGGLSMTYLPDRKKNPYFLKFLASSTQIAEVERFDIIGFYRLGQVESNPGSDQFGEIINEIGNGTQQQFVRNYLVSNVTNIEHKGGFEIQSDKGEADKSHFLEWGVKMQREFIDDEIKEWERLDSAGYSLNYDTSRVLVNQVFKSEKHPGVLSLLRLFSGYLEHTG